MLRHIHFLLARLATRDTVVDGFRIERGTNLIVGIYALHRDPALWDAPETFDPDRFSAERSRGRDRWQFLPFGAGARSCIGDHFAMLEATLGLASLVRRRRVTSLDPALECPPILAPLIDPNLHSCGTVRPHGARELAQPEHGFYFAGMKSYGRAPTFLMMTGYEQVRSIVANIAGDREAAERVELVLPETGVCSRPVTEGAANSAACCGGPAPAEIDTCCRQDADGESDGAKGCGCS